MYFIDFNSKITCFHAQYAQTSKMSKINLKNIFSKSARQNWPILDIFNIKLNKSISGQNQLRTEVEGKVGTYTCCQFYRCPVMH